MKPPRKWPLVASVAALGWAVWIGWSASFGRAAEPAGVANAPYRDPKLPVDKRVADLLARMTPAEKVAQLVSVNWEHTHLDDPKTHAFSPELAQKLIADGIGEITRPSDRHDARRRGRLTPTRSRSS